MRFGFFLMPCHSPREDPALAFQRDLEMVERAEALGYEEFWVGEHHSGGWENIPAPDIFLGAAAQRTHRIRLGVGVVNLPYHHPFHVAERMAFLDQLTLGRAMLGVGPGALGTDVKLFGLNTEDLRPMAAEALEIILRLYRDERAVDHEGRFWTLRDAALQVRPYQEPHLPIAMATFGRGLEVIAREGLDLLTGTFFGGVTMETMRSQWEKVERLAAEHGRTADRSGWRIATYVYVAESAREAMEQIREGVEGQMREYFFNLGPSKKRFEDYPGQPWGDIKAEQLMRKGEWIVGDPDEVARRIRELDEGTGGIGCLLNVVGEWATPENWNRSMELFARYVRPQLRRSTRSVQAAHERMIRDSREGTVPNPFTGGLFPPVVPE